jgi:hypothetical protein
MGRNFRFADKNEAAGAADVHQWLTSGFVPGITSLWSIWTSS